MDISSEMAAVQQRIAAILGADGYSGSAPASPAQPTPEPSSAFGTYLAELMAPSGATQASAPMLMPVSGEITSEFGPRANPLGEGTEFHPGIDIAADQGAPIQAATGGRVVAVGREGGYGNLITIDAGNGLTTRYAHCSQIFARVGQLVAPGDVVAAVGTTGRATGPHLHFEVRQGDQPVDPLKYLPIR